MTHKRFRILWPILIICILVLATIALYQKKTASDPVTDPERPSAQQVQVLMAEPVDRVTVYFYTKDQKNLLPLSFPVNTTRAAANVAIELLLSGPPNQQVCAVTNDGAKLQEIYQEDGQIFVNLTAIDKTSDPAPLVAAVGATLGNLMPQKKVQILIDSEPLPAPFDEPRLPQPVNYYGKEDALTDHSLITVFYGDEVSGYLVPVTLPVLQETPKEEALQKLQTSAPQNSGLKTLTFTDCPLTLLRVDQGKAVLNFSSAVLQHQSTSLAEKQMLEAVIATFSQFKDINAIQFFVEENVQDHLPGGNEIDIPFPAEALPTTNIL